jgi:hypothetical protein
MPNTLNFNFARPSHHFDQVDVYSFGIVMWELATRQTPWDELGEVNYLQLLIQLEAALKTGRRPKIPASIISEHSEYVALLHCFPFLKTVCALIETFAT